MTDISLPWSYVYRYPDGALRMSGGCEVNGSKPVEAIGVYLASTLKAAEARVRELEAERDKWDRRVAYDELQAREHENRATQQRQIDALTIRAEAAERALAEAYERCAKVAEIEGAYPELNVWAGGPEWYRHGLRIATAIRNLAQEERHAKAE